MRFSYFRIENFKGIEKLRIELSANGCIYPLVGLNESGKTSILEAINYFRYKNDMLHQKQIDNHYIKDIHDIIPISKRANFNERITIEAGLKLNDLDKAEISKKFSEDLKIQLTEIGESITFAQNYAFIDSKFSEEKSSYTWTYQFLGRKIGSKAKPRKIENKEALKVLEFIKLKIPSILYFPNFLFDLPEKIYLSGKKTDEKHAFYQNILQDVLDTIEGKLNLEQHIAKRILSADKQDKLQLRSAIDKLENKLTEVVFKKWNSILGKKLPAQSIRLQHDKDDNGPYVEFFIQDKTDSYLLSERSLGFRWFFVFILLTQFRGASTRQNRNAIFLLDEPASNLHPSAQKELIESFKKLDSVIYTTHSHYMINPNWLETTFVIKNEGIDYDNEENFTSKKTNIKAYKYREFSNNHPNQTSYYQPILEALDYKPAPIEPINCALITEGKNDFYSISLLAKSLEIDINFSIIPGTSSSNMETLIALYVGWGKNFLVLLDSDKEGLKQKDLYLEKFGPVITERIFCLHDIDPTWSGLELEDLFDQEDKAEIQDSPDKKTKFNKKLFNRSIQEIFATQNKVSPKEGTKNKFSKLLGFLNSKLTTKAA